MTWLLEECALRWCALKSIVDPIMHLFTHYLTKQPVIQNASCAERSMREVHARVKDPPEGRTIELAGTLQSPHERSVLSASGVPT
jgi:hypothetical protein